MKLKSFKIGIYKGFKKVSTTYMITKMNNKEAIEHCKGVFIGRTCRIEKE